MARIKIKLDAKALDAVLANLTDKKQIAGVIRKGLNAGARLVRKQAVKDVTGKYAAKRKDVTKAIKLKTAKGKRLSASVRLPAFALGLEKFPINQNETGIAGSIGKAGSFSLPHAFLAPSKGSTIPRAFVRTRAMTSATRRFVSKPSTKAPHRSKKGSELPINRLKVDIFKEARSEQNQLKLRALGETKTAEVMAEEVDRLLDVGAVK